MSTKVQNLKTQTCSYHKYGHCKEGVECDKYHSKKVCKDLNCDVKGCNDRHPRPCAFYSAGICKFPKDCSFSHKKVDDMISLRKEMSEMKTKYSSAIKTIEKQGKIINVLREQVNSLQGEVLNIMRNMSEIEEFAGHHFAGTDNTKHEEVNVDMDVDTDNLKASKNMTSLVEVTWDESEDMAFKDLLYLEKNIAEKVRDELTDVHKNLKKRKLDETKGKVCKIGFWLKEKEREVVEKVEKDSNHRNYYNEEDIRFQEMGVEMHNLIGEMELTSNKKVLEDNLEKMIDVADNVRTAKCTEIWNIYDEIDKMFL